MGILLLGASASTPSSNTDRVTLNLPTGGYANYFKTWLPLSGSQQTVSPVDADGYPVGTLSSDYAAEIAIAGDYYDKYTWAWTGAGGMQILSRALLVYSGGTFVGLGGATGTVIGNPYFFGTNLAVVFKFGVLVSAVSGGSGSLVTIEHANNGGIQTGTKVKFGVGCSANLSSGPNADGSWTVTNVDATHITLDGSAGVTSPTVTGSGGINTQTEAVFNVASITPYYTNGQTYTSFTNIILCKTSNYASVVGGMVYDPVFTAQLQELSGRPGGVGRGGDFWLRYMDVIGVQGSFECDFAQRRTLTSQCYQGTATPTAYAAGNITRSGSDLYTCASNPSGSPASGPPVDCEIIQGIVSATNTGSSPTLTNPRSGFGTWPITFNVPMFWTFSGPPASTGLTLQWTFSAPWLNGGTPYVFPYVTTASGPFGDDTSNFKTFAANLREALAADAILLNKVSFRNVEGVISVYPLTPLAGAFSVSSVPAICTVNGSLPSSTITAGVGTFVFNKLLGAFIYTSGGMILAPPLEVIASLSNSLNASVWWTWPSNTKPAYIEGLATFFANNLNSGLKFGGEFSNEVWNFGLTPWGQVVNFACALGMPNNYNSYAGLRTKNYGDLSLAAWTAAGRSASDHHVFNMGQMGNGPGPGGDYDNFQCKGALLDASTNTTFANYGGLGATSSPSLNASPNRPIDVTTAIGFAPYWTTPWWTLWAYAISGTVADNAPWLQAAKDYAAGNTTTAIVSIMNQLNGTTTRPGSFAGNVLGYPTTNDNSIKYIMELYEAQAASYDSGRPALGKAKVARFDYEGGPQWFPGADFNSGVNEVSAFNINALADHMTNLGWNVSAYTTSGTDNKTEMATMTIILVVAIKYSTEYKDMIKASYYGALKAISGSNREVHGAQYGYNRSTWGFFPLNYSQGNAFTNYNAFAEYNL